MILLINKLNGYSRSIMIFGKINKESNDDNINIDNIEIFRHN
jgi:hypothetical protein